MIDKKGFSAFLGSCLIGSSLFAAPVRADDLALQYQILLPPQGINSAIGRFKVRLVNLSSEDLVDLSVGVLTALSAPTSGTQLFLEGLPASTSTTVIGDLAVPAESISSVDRSLRFYVDYETADGERRTAVIQSEATVFAGEIDP